MRIFYFFLIIFIFSCSKYGERMQKKWCHSETHDSAYTILKYIHDSINVPYEAITFDTTTDIPFSVVFHKEIDKGVLKSSFDIHKGKITFKCETDSLKKVIDSMKILSTYHEKVSYKLIPCDKKHVTGAISFAIWWAWISIPLLIILTLGYFYILAAKK